MGRFYQKGYCYRNVINKAEKIKTDTSNLVKSLQNLIRMQSLTTNKLTGTI